MRIMAVVAHPDDEIGCAGTLARHTSRNDAAMIVWTTYGENASQFGDTPRPEVAKVRTEHGEKVAKILGTEHRFLGFEDAGMTGGRDEALAIAKVIAEFKPDAVITWNPEDVHPDHRATYWATLSALKLCRIPKLVGEAHRKTVKFYHYYRADMQRPLVSIDITPVIEVKLEVFQLYRDFYKWEFTNEQFFARAKLYGQQAGVDYAERFLMDASVAPAYPYLPQPGMPD
ncbi:MAG: PIG-L deacetylase family protein [Deinococcota bacterium]